MDLQTMQKYQRLQIKAVQDLNMKTLKKLQNCTDQLDIFDIIDLYDENFKYQFGCKYRDFKLFFEITDHGVLIKLNDEAVSFIKY